MNKLSLSILALLLLSGASSADEIQIPIALEPGAMVAIRVDQRGQNLVLEIDDGIETYSIDHPIGGDGPEYFTLGPYESSRVISVAARTANNTPVLKPAVETIELNIGSDAASAFNTLSRAGQLTPSKTENSLNQAIQYYQEAAQSFLVEPQYKHLSYYARFLEATLRFELFDLDGSLAALSHIPEDSCAVPGYCYKNTWLEAQIKFMQDRYIETAVGMNAALDDIDRAGLSDIVKADISAIKADLGLSLTLARRRQTDEQKLYLDELFAPLTEEKMLNEALAIGLELANPLLIGRAYSNIAGYYHHQLKDDASAVDYLLQAIDYLSRTEDKDLLISTYSNLSITYRSLGEYGLAQKAIHETLHQVETSLDPSNARESYNQLSELYLLLGDLSRAERFARQTISYDQNSGIGRLYAAQNILGKILRQKGEIDEAISLHQDSLKYYQGESHTNGTASSLYQLGVDYLEGNDLSEARRYFEESRQSSEYGNRLAMRRESVRDWARLLLAEEKYSEAIEFLLEANSNFAEVDRVYASSIEISQLLMQAYQSIGDVQSAIEFGDKSIELISNIRGRLEFYRLGPAWSARTNHISKQFVSLLLEQYYSTGSKDFAERAFVALEKSRAANFLQQRAAATTDDTDKSPTDKEEALLRRQLTLASQERANTDVDDQNYEQISQVYFRTLERYQAKLRQENTGIPLEAAGFDELRDKIPPNTAAVEYLCVQNDSCHVFIINNGQLEAKKLASYDEILLTTNAATNELRQKATREIPGIEKLGKLVLSNILPESAQELLIVSDYPLNTVPFSALDISKPDEKYRPLIEDYTHTLIPSLGAYNSSQTKKLFSNDLVVLADPVFSSLEPSEELQQDDTYRGWVSNLPRLPWTANEAEALQAIFSNKTVEVFVGSNATRSNLMDVNTRNSRIVHIASHAFFDSGKSDLVGIALSSDQERSSGEGDFITVNELFNSQFNSELVVISGCETGQGEYQDGEGMMSLARGFLAQGVENVISTLWPVSDRASSIFMKEYYDALNASEEDYAGALREAQKRLRNHPVYRAPFYWAGYIITSAG